MVDSIPGYRLENLLGESPQAKVYVGHYVHVPHHKLIIKILTCDSISDNVKRYFLQKIEHLKIIKDDHLIAPLSYQEIMGVKFITRRYEEGITLREWTNVHPLMSIEDFFTIAMQMADLLEKIHNAGIVHGGIKPSNILIEPTTLKIKIIDFITPFDIRNVSHYIYHRDFIRNTLSYTSPEQIGRINHRVEFTTDIYSLGVIFYEMLAKKLPFESLDPLEIIHSHLAEEALFLNFSLLGMPKVLGRVIDKMLSKRPEKRYQRGFGLLADLIKCKQLSADNLLEEIFPLGMMDHSHRLTFISVMVGREAETEMILNEYSSVAQGEFRSLMISGLSGIGKTRLIQELQKPIIKNKGYFTSGKFDVYHKNVPYSSLIQAFRNLIRTFLTESDERVVTWKNTIQQAVGFNGSLITDIIPELSILIGPQAEVPTISPVEARNRFNLVFSNFIISLASQENPLVLFIDDLQWCDLASFEFLTNIFLHSTDHPYLFLIGAYRNNEVSQGHPLVEMMTLAKRKNKPLKEIHIGPILESDTNKMVAYILDGPISLTKELGIFLHNLTEGNPLFISESLSYLYNEKLLYFHPTSHLWIWSLDKIKDSHMPLTIVGLFSSKIQQLSPQTLELLEFCACLGNLFTPDEISLVKEIPLITVYEILMPVLAQGLLIENKDQLQFIHDKVQEATLLLIDHDKRKKIHRQIGQHLYAALAPDTNLDKIENIFTIASHLNLAYQEILPILPEEEAEKLLLAKLNYHAGNAALNSLATTSANEFYLQGLKLLPKDSWNNHYQMTYQIYQKLAKTELMMGHYQHSEELLNKLLLNAQSDLDKAEALAEQTSSLSSFGNFISAIETANKGLNYFNSAIPLDASIAKEKCQKLLTEIHTGHQNIWKTILDMPFTNDRKHKIELAFYSELIPDLYMSGLVDQLYLSAAQSTQHCLNGGMDESVIYSFSIMGLNLGEQEQFEYAFHYEDLAKNLCEKYPNTFGATRGMNGVVWCNMHSRSHPQDIALYCLKAIQSGKNCGDLYNAGLSYGPLLWNLQVQGNNFSEIEKYANECLEFSTKYQLSFSVALAEAMLEGWVFPMKKNYFATSINEKIKTWEAANHIAAIGSYYVHQGLMSYYFGAYYDADISIKKVKNYLHGLTDNVLKRQWFVLQVLNDIKLFEIGTLHISKQNVLDKINPILEKIQRWASFGPLLRPYLKFALAEKRRLETDLSTSWNEYSSALNEAHSMGYTFLEGFIYETLGILYQAQNSSLSQLFISHAIKLYQACNATQKMYTLYEQIHPSFGLENIKTPLFPNITSLNERQNGKNIDDFYFIKASQAISTGMNKKALMHKSIEIFTNSTGAQYGTFALIHNQKITEFANYFSKHEVSPSKTINSNILGLLRFVQRTKEIVLINNKNTPEMYKDLIDLSEIKAILCLPIIKNNNVLGIIYLESKISDAVFPPKEVEMVELLSLQVAITLENINLYEESLVLYEEVKKENKHRKEIEKDLLLAKNNADLANASKSLFLANMSHEIRTPLHSIIGATECLLDGQFTEEQTHLIKLANTSGENLLHIINDILDLSRIESGSTCLEQIAFSLNEELQSCIDTISIQAKEKNISLEYIFDHNIENLRQGDPTRLKQIIINLLSNAIKFSDQGTVSLEVSEILNRSHHPNLLFSIHDQGIGISEQNIATIFDRFHQADDSITRRFGGSGLGLAISKKLVELMNGKIWVESKINFGSTFKFEIYLPINKQKKQPEHHKTLETKNHTETALVPNIKPLNILLVDDSEDNRLIFTKFIQKYPHTITNAENGQEALDAFTGHPFDIVFMDLQMPIMDGRTATKKMREWEKENHKQETPIIAFTAHAFEEDMTISKQTGFNDHITKPLKRDKLIAVISEYT